MSSAFMVNYFPSFSMTLYNLCSANIYSLNFAENQIELQIEFDLQPNETMAFSQFKQEEKKQQTHPDKLWWKL